MIIKIKSEKKFQKYLALIEYAITQCQVFKYYLEIIMDLCLSLSIYFLTHRIVLYQGFFFFFPHQRSCFSF